MISLDAYQKSFRNLPEGVKDAEVNAETHRLISVQIEQGKISGVKETSSVQIFVRVKCEHTGYAYTEDPEEDAAGLLKQAYENSLYSTEDPEPFSASEEIWSRDQEVPETIEELKQLAMNMDASIAAKIGTWKDQTECMLELTAETYGQHTVNRMGMDRGFTSPVYLLSVTLAGEDLAVKEERMSSDPEEFDLSGIAEALVRRLQAGMIPAVLPQAGSYEVILSSQAAGQMFMTAWQIFSGGKLACGDSCLSGQIGQKVSSDVLTIIDTPDPDGGFPAFLDSEGTKGQTVSVVKNGVFVQPICSLKSAELLQVPPTGNAGRRPLLSGMIPTDIKETPKNFCILPGTSSLEEMEAHMGDGFLITEYFDLFHSLNIASGDFSVPVHAVRIRDGKECGMVRGLTMSGNFRTMLREISEVGSEAVIRPMEYLRNYGIGTCPIRIGKVTLSGE
ncbi:MAG: metallopeptidase TldD-related protein [Stecheria intestinalis]|nr:metallopeptidase TldD-related protein [Stecheria intestinalis]MDY4681040.1 metallopeptidase TldD-related protein [Lachnospiraceae bacterium]